MRWWRTLLLRSLYGYAAGPFIAWERRLHGAGVPVQVLVWKAFEYLYEIEQSEPHILDSSKRHVAAMRLNGYLRYRGWRPEPAFADLAVKLAFEAIYADRERRGWTKPSPRP